MLRIKERCYPTTTSWRAVERVRGEDLPVYCMWFFFFQAEDGIRDSSVTGVQTCALPILGRPCGAHWCTPTLAASFGNSAAALPPEGAQFAPWGGPAALIHHACRGGREAAR